MHTSLRWRAFPAVAWVELTLSYHEFYFHPPLLSADSMRHGQVQPRRYRRLVLHSLPRWKVRLVHGTGQQQLHSDVSGRQRLPCGLRQPDAVSGRDVQQLWGVCVCQVWGIGALLPRWQHHRLCVHQLFHG